MAKKGDNVRRNILMHFRNLLIEKGYKGASFRQLSKVSGVSLGNICFYFKKKDSLMMGLSGSFDKSVEDLVDRYHNIPENDPILRMLSVNLLRHFFISRSEPSYRVAADMNCAFDSHAYDAKIYFDMTCDAFVKADIKFDPDMLLLNCLNASMDHCIMCNFWYTRGLPLDYNKLFKFSIKTIFFDIEFGSLDEYIQKAINILAQLDKDELVEALKLESNKNIGIINKEEVAGVEKNN